MTEKTVLPQNVQDAIRANLPEHISALLRNRLAEADRVIAENATLKSSMTERDKVLKNLENSIRLHSELDSRERDMTKREDGISERERNLKVTMLTVELDAEKRLSSAMKDALMGLMRNTTYREAAFHAHEKVTDYQNGNSVTTAIPTSTTKERITE